MSLTGTSNQQSEFDDIVSGLQGIDLSSTTRTTALFFCPLCRFRTTKEGMLTGAAAKHLKEAHQVTGAMMRNSPSPSTYKFRKSTVRQPLKTLMKSRSGGINKFRKSSPPILSTTSNTILVCPLSRSCGFKFTDRGAVERHLREHLVKLIGSG